MLSGRYVNLSLKKKIELSVSNELFKKSKFRIIRFLHFII